VSYGGRNVPREADFGQQTLAELNQLRVAEEQLRTLIVQAFKQTTAKLSAGDRPAAASRDRRAGRRRDLPERRWRRELRDRSPGGTTAAGEDLVVVDLSTACPVWTVVADRTAFWTLFFRTFVAATPTA
jgi:hypothetical protein